MEQLTELTKQIDQYLRHTIGQNELEQSTLSIIADEDFDMLPSNIQNIIYALDSKDLNDLNNVDISIIRDQLNDFIYTQRT